MFIDQLGMIQEKTRGNLTTEESTVLRNALASLQMAFVEASQGGGARPGSSQATEASRESSPVMPAEDLTEPAAGSASTMPPEESKKKFTKSYGS
jgi:hypothetical protein